jgi:hypothetical protein
MKKGSCLLYCLCWLPTTVAMVFDNYDHNGTLTRILWQELTAK